MNAESFMNRLFQALFTVLATAVGVGGYFFVDAVSGTFGRAAALLCGVAGGAIVVGLYLTIWEVEVHNLLFKWMRR